MDWVGLGRVEEIGPMDNYGLHVANLQSRYCYVSVVRVM